MCREIKYSSVITWAIRNYTYINNCKATFQDDYLPYRTSSIDTF